MKILVTGATGLVGSSFVHNIDSNLEVETIGRENVDRIVDLTSENEVTKVVDDSVADLVINFAANTNVEGAEEEKGNEKGEVYVINALLPLWLAKACRQSNKRLIHISTDFVFDGKQADRPYTEEDLPTPVDSWYARSKLEGENNVKAGFGGDDQFTIVRIAYPYSGSYDRKLDFARVIVERLRLGKEYFGITDQKITPVFVDEVSKALKILISNGAIGIYHVAGKYPEGFISPYGFAKKLAVVMGYDPELIQSTSFAEFSSGRVSIRPQHTWLDTAKIQNLGMRFADIDECLNNFKQQIENAS